MDVKEPLLSAAGVEEKGNDVFLSEAGRYIIWKGSPAQREIRGAVARILGKHEFAKTAQLYKENGVYNVYLKVAEARSDSVPGPTPKELCPLAKSTSSSDSSWKVMASKKNVKQNGKTAKNSWQDSRP
jgi:hypothetical protein